MGYEPCIGRALGGLQHRATQQITGRQPQRRVEGSWYYPLLGTYIQEAGLEEMGYYMLKRQNNVDQYITAQLILDLY